MAPRALLFDLDGTLWDSFPWYARVLSASGAITEPRALEQLRAGASVVRLADELGLPRARFIRSCVEAADELALFDDVTEVLAELAPQIPLGVVTSLPGSLAEPVLQAVGLRPVFSTVIHAGNCRSRKPNPGPLLAALEQLGVGAGEDVVYVGDHANDGEAARRAGLSFAWASYGYGSARPVHTSVMLTRFGELRSR